MPYTHVRCLQGECVDEKRHTSRVPFVLSTRASFLRPSLTNVPHLPPSQWFIQENGQGTARNTSVPTTFWCRSLVPRSCGLVGLVLMRVAILGRRDLRLWPCSSPRFPHPLLHLQLCTFVSQIMGMRMPHLYVIVCT